jgi:hypothetical protein
MGYKQSRNSPVSTIETRHPRIEIILNLNDVKRLLINSTIRFSAPAVPFNTPALIHHSVDLPAEIIPLQALSPERISTLMKTLQMPQDSRKDRFALEVHVNPEDPLYKAVPYL